MAPHKQPPTASQPHTPTAPNQLAAPAEHTPSAALSRLAHLRPGDICALQHTSGNQAVQRLLRQAQNPSVQRTLIQRGRDKRPPESARTEMIKNIGTFADTTMYYTRSAREFHVEAWAEGKQVAIVDIIPGNVTVLHTHSDEQGGRGTLLMSVAIKVIAEYHAQGDGFVELPMGGGAIVKLMVSKLSQVFGDPEIYKQARQLQKERKEQEQETPPTTQSTDKNNFDEKFLPEHMLDMKSLLAGDAAKDLQINSPLGKVVTTAEEKDLGSEVALGSKFYMNQLLRAPKLTVVLPNKLFVKFANELS